MNKVITINLGGNAYQLEEGGYDLLRAYLETAAARLQENPDRDEILSDIEGALGEKLRSLLTSYKTVIETKEVAAILAAMGPVEADADPAQTGTQTGAGGSGAAGKERPADPAGKPRRLYRIYEGAMISGVCNGLAAYVNVDPTLVRLAFVLLTIFWGTGVLVYLVMAIVVPEAVSPEEKAEASGLPGTAQEFIRRAKAGYYEATKNFPKYQSGWKWNAHRLWGRRFGRSVRAQAEHWRHHWIWYPDWDLPGQGCCPGMGLAIPLLSLLKGALTIIWVCAFISLLATGAILGMTLPANVPVWVAALLLFIAYGILAGSLKVARRVCYWGLGPPRGPWSFVFFLDAAIWFLVVAALLWLAIHYFPELRAAVQTLPAQAHQAANDFRDWWKAK